MMLLSCIRARNTGRIRPFIVYYREYNIPLPWDRRRKAREDGEIDLIKKTGSLLKILDGPLCLPQDSSFHRWLQVHGQGAEGAPPRKEDFQKWLTSAENELGGLAKPKTSVFAAGREWWNEGSKDYQEATGAVHYLHLQQLCVALKKCKAVFTPHIPGDNLKEGVMEKVVRTIQANMEGDLESRLQASWRLHDESPLGLGHLSEQAMEEAIYTALAPPVAVAAQLYPTLPNVTRAQKKAFTKYIQYYTRDQADFPTKLRCIFAWAQPPPPSSTEKEVTTPTPVVAPSSRVVDFENYLKTQSEEFPEMHQVGANSMALYGRVREAYYAQKMEDRGTFRIGLAFFVGLGFVDSWVSSL